jgi:multimeric flavodoxin WrbA
MALVIGINGSPRKGRNTHRPVKNALGGAASQGAETELVNLYDLSFQGWVGCFSPLDCWGPSKWGATW